MGQVPLFQAGGDPNHQLKGISVIGLFRPVPKVTGKVYPINVGRLTSAAIPAVDTIYFAPFFMPDTFTMTAAKLRVGTGGAGSSIKGGIWANSPISNRPLGAPLIVDNTGVATTGTGVTVSLALAGTLNPGFYWFGVKTTGTPPALQALDTSTLVANMMGLSDPVNITISFADAYANALPTIAEGASFSETASNVIYQCSPVSA